MTGCQFSVISFLDDTKTRGSADDPTVPSVPIIRPRRISWRYAIKSMTYLSDDGRIYGRSIFALVYQNVATYSSFP